MAGRTRSSSRFPRVAIARDSDSDNEEEEESSADEEEDEEEEEEEPIQHKQNEVAPNKSGKRSIAISLQKVCKVCKQKGHEAGFKGATYIDCPKKPCYLCKQPGHTTMTCPHRVATEYGVVPAPRKYSLGVFDYVHDRQIRSHVKMIKPTYVIPNMVDCAIIRLHSRRVTYLEFHPTNNNILVSGDKRGHVAIWDYKKVDEKSVYDNVHSCIVNTIKFHPANDGVIFTAGSDGTLSYTDIETGIPTQLIDLNPDGWNGPSTWRMLYGMDINPDKSIAFVADNFGFLYQIDIRTNKAGKGVLIHKKGSKVVGLHVNPVESGIMLSCGNDHFARLWDIRNLGVGLCLAELPHTRVVSSAYFSPRTGTKIMTTCLDNRIRIWDSIFGDLTSPSREIVHSHDFNRYLTSFRAEWDPKDPSENLSVIGRYISENYNGVALHPIDFIDTSNGQLVAEVVDPNITTITPVNKLHPREDVLASGSSRSLFIWRPKEEKDMEKTDDNGSRSTSIYVVENDKKGKKKFEDDDDEDDFPVKRKGKSSSKRSLVIK